MVDALGTGVGGSVRERGLVLRHHPPGEVPLCRPDRPAGRSVQLDGEVGDAAGGDVGGHVELAAAHDAEVDDALARRGGEAPVGGRQAGVLERVHQLVEGLAVVDPAEELPDRPEVVDVVDQRGAGECHQQGPRRTGPDAVGEREDVLRTLRGLVLDEVSLVHDHAAEAEVAEPAQVAVEHLVVEHDDIGEAVDRLAVALHHGGRPAGRPAGRLTGPVGLDDVRHDDEQRVGVRRFRGEQRLGRLAQTRLIGEQERPVTGSGRGDQLPLMRHQLQARRGEPCRRRRERHARRGSSAGLLEGTQQRAEQLPAGQAAPTGRELRDGGEVRGQEGVRQLPGDHRRRHDPPLRVGRSGRGLRRSDLFGRRLDAEVPRHLPLERPGRVGDAGILGEQRQQPSVPDGGPREDGRDAVQPLELLSPATAGSGRCPDAGALVPQQQGGGLELRTHGRRHAAALGSRLDLTGGPDQHRDDVVAVAGAPLLPRGGTDSARLALAWSSHRLLLCTARPRWPRQHAAHSPAAGAKNVPGTGPSASNAEPACGSPRINAASHASHAHPEPPVSGLVTTARGKSSSDAGSVLGYRSC